MSHDSKLILLILSVFVILLIVVRQSTYHEAYNAATENQKNKCYKEMRQHCDSLTTN